jgi:hypothetical protein
MAWIEQTKKGSRKSGGPQYYLQDLSEGTKALLERQGRVSVALWSPYGPVIEGLEAVSSRIGSVGHDRIQNPSRKGSVADRIAYWYSLTSKNMETIEVKDFPTGRMPYLFLHLRPVSVKPFGGRRQNLKCDEHPLTVVEGMHSNLVRTHIREMRKSNQLQIPWIREQICRLSEEHAARPSNLDERDILRAAGALDTLGITLGPYCGKGIDCVEASFQLGPYPRYPCPIEIEATSKGFQSEHHKKHKNMRLVVLCMSHNAPVITEWHDVLELRALCELLESEE